MKRVTHCISFPWSLGRCCSLTRVPQAPKLLSSNHPASHRATTQLRNGRQSTLRLITLKSHRDVPPARKMAETEYYSANKRKASPLEDAIGKRMRLEDGDANRRPSSGSGAEAEDISDQHGPTRNERNGLHTEGSPTRTRRADPEPESRRSPEARRPSATAGPPVRRNVSMEEKKRGQRLFGGLVSTLSRTTSSTQQQRRLEIERRQHEKAQQRRAEDEKRRAEKLEQLKRVRQIEQVKLDERAVCP